MSGLGSFTFKYSMLKLSLQSSNECPIMRKINTKKYIIDYGMHVNNSNVSLVQGLMPINNLNHNDDGDDNVKEMMMWGDCAIDGTSTSGQIND